MLLGLLGLLVLLPGHAVGQAVGPVAAAEHDAMRVAALVVLSLRSVSPNPVLIESTLRLAALGDPAASRSGCRRGMAAAARHVGWLQFAARLGSDEAACALALHYRRDAQPLRAARREARAIELGFQPPPALDHRRR